MIQINIVDTLLGYLGEYVNVNICDLDTYKIVSSYDGRNSIDEKYLGCEVKDFVVDNGLVTIWIEIKQLLTFKKRCGIIRRKLKKNTFRMGAMPMTKTHFYKGFAIDKPEGTKTWNIREIDKNGQVDWCHTVGYGDTIKECKASIDEYFIKD